MYKLSSTNSTRCVHYQGRRRPQGLGKNTCPHVDCPLRWAPDMATRGKNLPGHASIGYIARTNNVCVVRKMKGYPESIRVLLHKTSGTRLAEDR